MKIGTDIVYIPRLIGANSTFAKGVLSKDERALYEGMNSKRKAEFLAGRFAAKEAYLKAMGSGLKGERMKDIDVRYREDGQPVIVVNDTEVEVSISHDGEYAIAVVMIA